MFTELFGLYCKGGRGTDKTRQNTYIVQLEARLSFARLADAVVFQASALFQMRLELFPASPAVGSTNAICVMKHHEKHRSTLNILTHKYIQT